MKTHKERISYEETVAACKGILVTDKVFLRAVAIFLRIRKEYRRIRIR